jgi:histidinol phosphatase-like PHP family hydrolase
MNLQIAAGKLTDYSLARSTDEGVHSLPTLSPLALKRRLALIVGTFEMDDIPVTNASLAELLALEAEESSGHLQRAFKRASRLAFLWPEEAFTLLSNNRPLTELPGIGPYLAKRLTGWMSAPPKVAEPPELRRGFLTLADTRRILARKPRWLEQLKGDLQMHTVWSDGVATIAAMAEAAQARGYKYIAITDHSQGLKIAGGMDEATLARQLKEIGQINEEISASKATFRVVSSIEMNLNPIGSGDMSLDSLRTLDVVLGSFHSALRRKEDQTDRYLAALGHPGIHILGHPRGRVYNFRVGLRADWAKVFDRAAALDKAVEIDGFPDRQDLDIDLLRLARAAGVRISLGTDAHRPEQLSFMEFALAAAIEAEIPRERILNFMSFQELLAWSRALTEQGSLRSHQSGTPFVQP